MKNYIKLKLFVDGVSLLSCIHEKHIPTGTKYMWTISISDAFGNKQTARVTEIHLNKAMPNNQQISVKVEVVKHLSYDLIVTLEVFKAITTKQISSKFSRTFIELFTLFLLQSLWCTELLQFFLCKTFYFFSQIFSYPRKIIFSFLLCFFMLASTHP